MGKNTGKIFSLLRMLLMRKGVAFREKCFHGLGLCSKIAVSICLDEKSAVLFLAHFPE